MTDTSRRATIAGLLALAPVPAFAQINVPSNLMKRLPSGLAGSGGSLGAGLSQGDIGAGLKEVLAVASRAVIGQVGKPDGYFGDPAIRIPLPGPLQNAASALRAIGANSLLDDLVLRMNRGAEQAAPRALDIFVDAVAHIGFDDARGILTGAQDAATQYFRRTTSGPLTAAFRPIVKAALGGAGALQAFQAVQARMNALPMVTQLAGGFDLVDFTVGKALDGIFHYLAREEAAIRTDPAARSTDLLRTVFR